jgi:hypothetical protein
MVSKANQIVAIYAQRLSDESVWEEIGVCTDENLYTGNTIAVVENPHGELSYDFSNCGEIDSSALNSFFHTIGVVMGIGGDAFLN